MGETSSDTSNSTESNTSKTTLFKWEKLKFDVSVLLFLLFILKSFMYI